MDREVTLSRPMLATLVILACSLLPERLAGAGLARLRLSLTSNLFNRVDMERIDRGYYEQLVGTGRRLDDLADVPCLRARRRSGSTWSIPVDEAPLVVRIDDLREVVLRRNDATRRWGLDWRTNSQGMRDREYSPHKPPGTVRIAFVGDSIGAGWGVNAEDRFESILEDLWNSRSKAISGLKIEIVNCAVPGHSPGQRWYHFSQVGWPMDPDLVIYEGTAADVGWDERRLHFLLARGLGFGCPIYQEALAKAGVKPNESPDDYKRVLRPMHWEILAGVYRSMAIDCQERGVPLVWVLIPRVGRKTDTVNQHSLVKMARAAGIAHVVDVTDVYDGLDPASLAIDADDFHPNESGHRRLAARLDMALSNITQLAQIWAPDSMRGHEFDLTRRQDSAAFLPRQNLLPLEPAAARGGRIQ